MAVAILDYAKYINGTIPERLHFAKSLVDSLEKYGFVKLRNHGIPEEHVKQLFQMIDRFFNLPLETRKRLEMEHVAGPQRGYQSFGVEKTAWLRDLHQDVEHFAPGEQEERETMGDEKEFFSMGPPDDTQYPNVWPAEPDIPNFRPFMSMHFQRTRTIGLHLVEAIALGLNIPATALLNKCQPQDSSYARLISYPEAPAQRLQSGRSQRIWPHTDEGVLTLLFQDQVGGLELEDRPNGRRFVPVAATPEGAPSEIVVNTSDALQRWTNGAIKAGLHQVNVPAALKAGGGVVPKRYSCPFFLGPNFEASIAPLPQFVSDECPAKYGEMRYLDYCNMLVQGNYLNRGSPEAQAVENGQSLVV